MSFPNKATSAALALLLTAAMSGCGSEDEATPAANTAEGEAFTVDGVEIADAELWQAAQEEGSMTLYTAVGEERANNVVDVFRESTGLEVELIRLPGGRLVERVLTEQGAGQLGADVIMQTDLVLANQEKDAGVFEPYCPPGLETVDEDLKQEDCSFYAVQTPIYAIGTNTAVVPEDEAPATWQDLLDPKWAGSKLGLAHIGSGGSTWARDLFLRNLYGVEYWEQLAAQEPLITGGAAGVTQQMARGEVQAGMVLPGNQSVTAAEGAPLELIIPEDGVPSYGHWAGLASGAESPNLGKVFLNWYLSLPGQTAAATIGGDYPVIEGAPGPDFNGEELPTREEIELVYPELTPEYSEKRDEYMEEWFQIFGYAPES